MSVDVTYSEWYTSSYSGANNNCVRTRIATYRAGTIEEQVQDSKNPDGGHLSFHPKQWSAFLNGVAPVRKTRT